MATDRQRAEQKVAHAEHIAKNVAKLYRVHEFMPKILYTQHAPLDVQEAKIR